MRDEAISYSSNICYDLLKTFSKLDLFEETLSNRVVRHTMSTVLAIHHYDGADAAQAHLEAILEEWK